VARVPDAMRRKGSSLPGFQKHSGLDGTQRAIEVATLGVERLAGEKRFLKSRSVRGGLHGRRVGADGLGLGDGLSGCHSSHVERHDMIAAVARSAFQYSVQRH
jgi:hypothetical protein